MMQLSWMSRKSRQLLAALALLLLSAGLPAASPAADRSVPVVILNSYHQGFTWTDLQVAGIVRTLRGYSPDLEIDIEYLDRKRAPGEENLAALRTYYRSRFATRAPAAVITTDNFALEFALAERESIFSGAPIVFSGINGFQPSMIAGREGVTGVAEEVDPAGSLDAAFRLQPNAPRVLVIADGTESGREIRAGVERVAADRPERARFRFLDDPTLAEVETEIARLPAGSFILLGNFNRDREGRVFSHEEALQRVVAMSRVPVYGLWEFQLGKGITGGSLLCGEMQGEHAARLALRIMSGEVVPVETRPPARLAFDDRQLRRFGLDAVLLPSQSSIVFQETSFYSDHLPQVLAIICIFLVLSGVILLLLATIAARRRAEARLRAQAHFQQTIIDALPAPIYYKDEKGFYLGCNAAFEQFLGRPKREIVGHSVFDVAPPELAQVYFRADRELFERQGAQVYEGEVQYADNTLRQVMFHKATFTHPDGSLGGLVGAMLDITDRRQREQEIEGLSHVAAALRTARSSDEMHPVLLESLLQVARVNGAFLLVRDSQGHPLIERGVGICQKMGGRIEATSTMMRQLFEAGQPFASEPGGPFPFPLPTGAEYLACSPMIAEETTIGVLCVTRQHHFPSDQLRLLRSVADMGANAIHRASLHERTERQVERLSALQSIDRAIISSHDFRLALDTLLTQLLRQLDIDAASVLLLSRQSDLLEFAAGRGFATGHIRQTRLRPGQGGAGQVASEGKLIYFPDIARADYPFVRTRLIEDEKFAAYFGVPLIARGQLLGVLELFHRQPLHPDEEWLEFLESLGLQAAIALDNALLMEGLQRSNTEILHAYDRTIEGWSRILDLRDEETEGHARRVTELSVRLARRMGFGEDDLIHLRRGALLHDIGKMGVPDQILRKPGPLSAEEMAVMRTHPVLAFEFLAPIDYLRPALEIPYCHHEKWDGSGYPRGLKGEQIPHAARLFAVVDVWDALTSNRPYRAAWPEEQAIRYLREESGRHFDPRIVEAFLSLPMAEEENTAAVSR